MNKSIYLLIFFFTAFLFFYLQSSPTLPDGDSFYHAKIAKLMIEKRGIVKEFPWLPFTILADYYYDHHFLFHLYLIPFILIFKDPLVSIKIATIILASFFFVIFYWFLKKYEIRYPFFYIFVLLTSYVLINRINLDKVPPASLIFILFGLYFLLKEKKIPLAILSFLYVWLYDAFPIILLLTIFYLLAKSFEKISDLEFNLKKLFYLLIINFFEKSNIKLLFSCLFGLLLGIIINPYFPNNLKFYWVHIIKIGILTPGIKWGVGAEWYPYDPFNLLKENLVICLLWLFSFSWFLISFKKPKKIFPQIEPILPYLGQNKNSLFFFLASSFFFIYTIKARRMGEYFVPLGTLFSAFTLNKLFINVKLNEYLKEIKKIIFELRFFTLNLLILYFLTICLGSFLGSTILLYQRMKIFFNEARPFSNFKGASQFLKENTPPKSIIFHNCWSYFPMLFYYNDLNYYIVGLDTTFMAEKNYKLFKLWRDIVYGKESENLAQKIKENFNSSYVVVEKIKDKKSPKKKFLENLEKEKKFKKIYEDEEAIIYQIF
jgi:hypothetical protein